MKESLQDELIDMQEEQRPRPGNPTWEKLHPEEKKLAILLSMRAPLSTRAIAAFLDYLVILTPVMLLSGTNYLNYDSRFLLPLIFGAFYFGLANSRFFNGQTLGKKAFGIRVISLKPEDNALFPYPGLRASLLRYIVLYGLMTVGAEAFENVYRYLDIAAPPILLNLHMLPLMILGCANLLTAICDPFHFSLHDRAARTMVVRPTSETDFRYIEDEQEHFRTLVSKGWPKARLGLISGFILGAVLWFAGIPAAGQVTQLESLRFRIERRWPVRFSSIQSDGEQMLVSLIPLDPTTDSPSDNQLVEAISNFYMEEFPGESINLKATILRADNSK
ncbi:MAG: RDD family protein [bacterium]|nr:RDD family protein [bacterium]